MSILAAYKDYGEATNPRAKYKRTTTGGAEENNPSHLATTHTTEEERTSVGFGLPGE